MHRKRGEGTTSDVRILVAGASGFAGRAIVADLLEAGHRVRGLARSEQSAARIEALGASVHRGSLADPNEIAAAARGCEAVVHAAGIASARAAPAALYWTHVAGTENLLRAAEHAGVRRAVVISCTDATLQRGPRTNWDEDRAPVGRPLGHRARSLKQAEEVAVGRARPPHFETLVLRAGWLWGAGDESRLPALCAEVRRTGALRLPGGGSYLLATTHVRNLAHAVRRALQAEGWEGHGVLHVTDAEMVLAAEFFGGLLRAVGLPPPRSGPPTRLQLALAWLRERLGLAGATEAEVAARSLPTVVQTRRIEALLGYEPVVSFEGGMAELADWARQVGGAEAIAARLRPPPGEEAVAAQIRAAEALG